MSQSDQWSVARLVRKSASLLAESLWEYWPTEGHNEISERNITLHLAVAFQNAGYRLYAEAHTKGQTNRRIDFVAFNPEASTSVLAECKRLYSAEKCSEIVEDVDRLRAFVPLDSGLGKRSFGVVAATTWNRSIVEWWSSSGAPPPGTHTSWPALGSALKGSHRGSMVLQTYDENVALEKHKPHHFLYAVFERTLP